MAMTLKRYKEEKSKAIRLLSTKLKKTPPDERLSIALKVGISFRSMDNYTKGLGCNFQTALQILEFI